MGTYLALAGGRVFIYDVFVVVLARLGWKVRFEGSIWLSKRVERGKIKDCIGVKVFR